MAEKIGAGMSSYEKPNSKFDTGSVNEPLPAMPESGPPIVLPSGTKVRTETYLVADEAIPEPLRDVVDVLGVLPPDVPTRSPDSIDDMYISESVGGFEFPREQLDPLFDVRVRERYESGSAVFPLRVSSSLPPADEPKPGQARRRERAVSRIRRWLMDRSENC